MKKTTALTVQSVAALSMMLSVALPLRAQTVPADLSNAAQDACKNSAVQKGFQVTDVVSVAPKGTDGANVVLSLTRNGQLYKLTCGYTKSAGAVFGNDTAAVTPEAPAVSTDLSPLWWLLLPLIGLPLLLWWAKGRGASTAGRAYEAIARRKDGRLIEVYSTPGTDSQVVATFRDGEPVALSGRRQGDWAELKEGGWVALSMLIWR